MSVEMVSIWVSNVCRNGALKSQILKVFSVLRVCLQHYTKVRIGNDTSHILEYGCAESGKGVDFWMPKVCRIGAPKSQIPVLFSVSMVCFCIVLSI